MKLLVTGGSGQVAWDLKKYAKQFDINLMALSHDQLDITQQSSIEKAIEQYQPQIIINTAAYTAVDQAEKEPELAYKINRDAAGLLAECCTKANLPLIHLSTDYIFNGCKQAPYIEEDSANPINIYGLSKYQGEQCIQLHLSRYIILRVSAIFGVHGNNFVKTIMRLSQQREKLQVVNDQVTCPTSASDIAETIIKIAQVVLDNNQGWGIYHYCAKDSTSWYDFAVAILDQIKRRQSIKVKTIDAISSEEFATLAKRPTNAVLNCDKIYQAFNIKQKSWRISLEKVIQELLA